MYLTKPINRLTTLTAVLVTILCRCWTATLTQITVTCWQHHTGLVSAFMIHYSLQTQPCHNKTTPMSPYDKKLKEYWHQFNIWHSLHVSSIKFLSINNKMAYMFPLTLHMRAHISVSKLISNATNMLNATNNPKTKKS